MKFRRSKSWKINLRGQKNNLEWFEEAYLFLWWKAAFAWDFMCCLKCPRRRNVIWHTGHLSVWTSSWLFLSLVVTNLNGSRQCISTCTCTCSLVNSMKWWLTVGHKNDIGELGFWCEDTSYGLLRNFSPRSSYHKISIYTAWAWKSKFVIVILVPASM